MRVLRATLLYFAVVFGVGLLLGPIRLMWVVPRFGTRWAELMEAPLMLAVIWLAAPWVVQKLDVPDDRVDRFSMGIGALVLMLIAEFSVVTLRGVRIGEYLATRDPVSASIYYAELLLFAVLPLFVKKKHLNATVAVQNN